MKRAARCVALLVFVTLMSYVLFTDGWRFLAVIGIVSAITLATVCWVAVFVWLMEPTSNKRP